MTSESKSTDGPFVAQFQGFAKELDAVNERRERIVKASRDVTYHSKKLIFALHRLTPRKRDATIAKAKADAKKIRSMMATRIAPELDPAMAPRFHRAYSPGMQEYVEAVTFLSFLSEGRLVTPEELQKQLDVACEAESIESRVPLSPGDYVLGVADLTGELMRAGVAAAGEGNRERVSAICGFLREVENGMCMLNGHWSSMGRDFGNKMRVLRQSVDKVEKSSFDVAVRRAEFGNPVAAGSADGPDMKRRRIG